MEQNTVALVSLIFIRIFITVNSEDTITVHIPDLNINVIGNFDKTSKTNQPYMQFRGIPYANSPRWPRFKPPVAKYHQYRDVDATKYGRICPVVPTEPKKDFWGHEIEDLEDCLNLSVYTKDRKKSQPVMYYVGAFDGSSSHKPPKDLLEKDIVLVVPQYRVGALGWLTTLSSDMPGNAAIHDIMLALRWVHYYIRYFGGDPKQVTIYCKSDGVSLVGPLLLSPITPPRYFNRAIIQSGSIFPSWDIIEYPIEQAESICNVLNCWHCNYGNWNIFKCLNEIPLKRLLEVTREEYFTPVVGDYKGLLPAQPADLIKQYAKEWLICINKLSQRVDKSAWKYENCYCSSVC